MQLGSGAVCGNRGVHLRRAHAGLGIAGVGVLCGGGTSAIAAAARPSASSEEDE